MSTSKIDPKKKIYISDVTLRDGMHPRAPVHPRTCPHNSRALDDARVDSIEISHGDGAGRLQLQLRLCLHTDLEWITAVASE